MEVDGSLVMVEFANYMSNFFTVLGFCTVATLILTFGYIFIFKPYDKEDNENY